MIKAAIAVSISYDSRLFILDERTRGLDHVICHAMLQMIYDYNKDGNRAVLLSSHITTDLEKICDYIVYIHEGKIIFNEEKDELLNKYAVYSIDEKQLEEIDKDALLRIIEREYGMEVLAKKDKMPRDFEYKPVTLDDIMLFYSKGERVC